MTNSDNGQLANVTIFAIPKAFHGHTGLIQRNAINSWKSLEPAVNVLLISDDTGTAEAAAEIGVEHVAGVETNEQGTPILSSAFELAHANSTSPLLMYCNSDVILLDDARIAIQHLVSQNQFDDFLGIGRRTDLRVEDRIDFDRSEEVEKLRADCRHGGIPAPVVCKEYFVFPRQLFREIPNFAVGRGNWDNWMVYFAKKNGIPVVNLSKSLLAIHQNHDYSHAKVSKLDCYVTGPEAKSNQHLAGGRHLVSGSTSDWHLNSGTFRRNRTGFMNGEFWSDIPRFARLLASFVRTR